MMEWQMDWPLGGWRGYEVFGVPGGWETWAQCVRSWKVYADKSLVSYLTKPYDTILFLPNFVTKLLKTIHAQLPAIHIQSRYLTMQDLKADAIASEFSILHVNIVRETIKIAVILQLKRFYQPEMKKTLFICFLLYIYLHSVTVFLLNNFL